jgi:hypothetical protein
MKLGKAAVQPTCALVGQQEDHQQLVLTAQVTKHQQMTFA